MSAPRPRMAAGPVWVGALIIPLLLFLVSWVQANRGNELQGLALIRPADGAPDGAWLSDLAVWFVRLLPVSWPLQTSLAIFSACVIGALLAWLYQRLVYNDWPRIEALFFVGCLAANSVIVGAVSADHRAIPLMLACAAVIPGIRRLESVGDVQAEMGFGIVLPLLFLAGPTTTLLIPVLALFGPWSDRVARSDGRAFAAMFLVAVLPTLIVLAGMLGMMGLATWTNVVEDVYFRAFRLHWLGNGGAGPLVTMATALILPFAILILAYLFQFDRRRQPWSAAVVLVLPAYLVAGSILFSWPMAPSAPVAAFLGAFAAWLSVARLRPVLRLVAITLMLLCTAMSWSPPILSSDPAWQRAAGAHVPGIRTAIR